MKGHVSLVGAGPGDPGLLTRTAVARLRAADLVLYDALVDERVLTIARRAQRFFVGKRAGRHALSQEDIHAVMIRAAKRGRRVVRLKGGDPFVFGRGGEEALALQAAGIPFDIVPGVTSAFAAPAAAGIPVTHRGLSAGFIVVSGHADSSYRPLLEMLPPQSVTVVVLMGLHEADAIASILVGTGWRPTTPVAVVFGASTSTSTTWIGTLASIASCRDGAHPDAPGTIVIGEVVSLAAVIGQQPAMAADPAAGRQESHVSHG